MFRIAIEKHGNRLSFGWCVRDWWAAEASRNIRRVLSQRADDWCCWKELRLWICTVLQEDRKAFLCFIIESENGESFWTGVATYKQYPRQEFHDNVHQNQMAHLHWTSPLKSIWHRSHAQKEFCAHPLSNRKWWFMRSQFACLDYYGSLLSYVWGL